MMVTTLPDTLAVSSRWKSFLRRKTSIEWSTTLPYILVELLYNSHLQHALIQTIFLLP